MRGRGKYLTVMLCALCVAGVVASCQKVELPAEEGDVAPNPPSDGGNDPGNPGGTGGNGSSGKNGNCTVDSILEIYRGIGPDDEYEEQVIGYIVGACHGTSMSGAVFTIEEVLKDSIRSNILIADSKSERDVAHCMPVELKKGSDVRDEANLVDNPERMGCRIGLYGLVKMYFRVVGLKSVEVHEWLPEEGNEPDVNPESPGNPNPEPEPGPNPEPDTNDTITIDTLPGHVGGGRSVGIKR